MAEFNLIDEPWIPCIDLDGNPVEYGIRDMLLKAAELREICDESPLVTVAIHRMLLAFLYRSFEGPSDTNHWKALYQAGAFPSNGSAHDYVSRCYDRFFLFDDTHPFMQVAGLDLNDNKNGTVKKDKSDGLMRLAREAPDKGGRVLFDHRVGTERPEYEPKQIAKMILAAQSYAGTGVASSGMLGNQKIMPPPCQFAPCVDGFVLWLQGDNLFETLMLNLVPHEVGSNDLPAWEDKNIVPLAIRSWNRAVRLAGPIQRFTPLSRFIRLLDKTTMFYTNGLKTVTDDDDDPMKAYWRESNDGKYKPLELRETKAAWRDAHTLFAVGIGNRKSPAALSFAARLARENVIDPGTQFEVNVVGLVTRQGKALLWRHERMPISLPLLSNPSFVERLGILLKEAESAGVRLSAGLFWSSRSKKTIRSEPVGRTQQITDLIVSPALEMRGEGILRKGDGRAPDEAHNKCALDLSENLDPRPAYWARLERHFFDLLEDLPKDWDEASGAWKPDDRQTATTGWRECVKREAKRALEESTQSLGRTARAIQAVARVRTDFSDDDLKPWAPKTAKARGKGGKKKT